MKASQEDQSHSAGEMGKMMTRRSRKVTQYRPDISSEILCNTTKPTSFLLWPSPGAATVNFDDDATVNNLLELRGIPLSADAEENKEALDNALRQTFDEQQQVSLMLQRTFFSQPWPVFSFPRTALPFHDRCA